MTRSELTAELVRLKSEFCRRVDEFVTRLGEPGMAAPPSQGGADGASFRGRPLDARYSGVCAVCGAVYEQGSRIVWNGDRKQAAHFGCGQADTRSAA